MEILIILTATVFVQNKIYIYQTDAQERLQIYLKSIKQWISTGFNIIIVENSGYTFPELEETSKLQIISYREKDIPECAYLLQNNSKGASELFSINYAFNNCKFKQSSFIIKVTARYFIPEFENYLKCINLNNFEIICQNDPMRCEFLGCNKQSFNKFFNISLILKDQSYCNHIEQLYNERINNFDKVLMCKKMFIEPTRHGGINLVNYYL